MRNFAYIWQRHRDNAINGSPATRQDTKMKTILLAGLIGIWAAAAMAHSPLDATAPANEATVSEVPTEILMSFKGEIRLTRVVITHADTQSMDIDLGEQAAFAQEFVLPMQNMGAGTYVIEWRGLGVDGHAQKGSFRFTVE